MPLEDRPTRMGVDFRGFSRTGFSREGVGVTPQKRGDQTGQMNNKIGDISLGLNFATSLLQAASIAENWREGTPEITFSFESACSTTRMPRSRP